MAGYKQVFEKLESGKTIIRAYDNDGALVEESHVYRTRPVVSITLAFKDGKIVDESYMVDLKSVSRKKYEDASKKFSDMPLAGSALSEAENIKEIKKIEHNEWIKEFKQHIANDALAKERDSRLMTILGEDGVISIDDNISSNVSVFFNQSIGRKISSIISRLNRYEISEIWIVGVDKDVFDEKKIDCKGMIIGLPRDDAKRADFFVMADKIAREDGFSGDMDDGQRYAFLRKI
jgi:hypothetical protein